MATYGCNLKGQDVDAFGQSGGYQHMRSSGNALVTTLSVIGDGAEEKRASPISGALFFFSYRQPSPEG